MPQAVWGKILGITVQPKASQPLCPSAEAAEAAGRSSAATAPAAAPTAPAEAPGHLSTGGAAGRLQRLCKGFIGPGIQDPHLLEARAQGRGVRECSEGESSEDSEDEAQDSSDSSVGEGKAATC